MTECPKCGGELWDNRPKKRSGEMKPNAPDFACKDKENCGWLQWPPKDKKVVKQAGGPGMPAESPSSTRQARWTWPTLSETYLQSLLIARKQVVGLATSLKLEVRLEDILSAAATVFIAASRDGVKLQAVSRVPDEAEAEVEA